MPPSTRENAPSPDLAIRNLRPDHIAIALALLATWLWTWFAGKDVSWDVFNHHLYLPSAWVTGQIHSDLFGAGPQSYQNPLGYFPFYAMVSAQWPAWLIGSALAASHATSAMLAWAISRRLWQDQPHAVLWCAIATAMAWVSPVFLQNAGTSSVDPLGSSLVLAALWCQLKIPDVGGARQRWLCLASGALLGLAFAVKQSSAVFVVAGGVLALWQWARRHTDWRAPLACGLGGVAGLTLGMGWYSWVMWSRFGNPVFPLFNNIFQSPFAPTAPVMAQRFIPDSAYGWVSRLWEMAELKRFVYQESFVPDLRPAVLLVVLLAGLMVALGLRLHGTTRLRVGKGHPRRADGEVVLFAAATYLPWLLTSGNGRYAIALMMLLGILLARSCYLLLPQGAARIAALTTLLLQTGYFVSSGDLRNSPEPWDDKPYMQLQVPRLLRDEAFLHVTFSGAQTNASVTTFFNHSSALTNPIGSMSIPMTGPLGGELRELFHRWRGRTRILMPALDPIAIAQPHTRRLFSAMLDRLGMDVDWNQCVTLHYFPSPAEPGSWFAMTHHLASASKGTWLSCRLYEHNRVDPALELERTRIDGVFLALERRCPQVYGPPQLVTERGLEMWERFYANSDTVVTVSHKDGVIASRSRVINARYIGTIEEVLAGKADVQCRLWSLSTPD